MILKPQDFCKHSITLLLRRLSHQDRNMGLFYLYKYCSMEETGRFSSWWSPHEQQRWCKQHDCTSEGWWNLPPSESSKVAGQHPQGRRVNRAEGCRIMEKCQSAGQNYLPALHGYPTLQKQSTVHPKERKRGWSRQLFTVQVGSVLSTEWRVEIE